jgi:hypothetical protein
MTAKQERAFPLNGCGNCGGTQWVDEDHPTPVLEGVEPQLREDGYPCPFCSSLAPAEDRALAWRELLTLIAK